MDKLNPVSIKLRVLRSEIYNNEQTFVVDYFGRELHVRKLRGQLDDLDYVICELQKQKENGKVVTVLRQHIETSRQRKNNSLEYWVQNIYREKLHRFGNVGKCNICGKAFEAMKGWKIDDSDVFFCNECRRAMREMVKPKEPKDFVRILSTPMGNNIR